MSIRTPDQRVWRSNGPALRRSSLRHVLSAALACSAFAAEGADRSRPALAAPVTQGGGETFGIAHIDVMDLHVERTPQGPIAREVLPAAELERRYRQARETGARWHRWVLYRDLIEESGSWAAADGIVARDVAHGLRTLMVLVPTGSGGAANVPEGLSAGIFVDANGSHTDDPTQAVVINEGSPWARFVAAAVRRYGPGGELAATEGWAAATGVRAWEVGNEPNLTHFWSGTPEDYARLLEVAYQVIHYLDPGAVVAHAGIADDANAMAWFNRFLDALVARERAAGLPARHGWFFDRTAWHWYSVPSQLLAPPAAVRAAMAARGIPERPLWVTEVGAPVWSEYPGPCWDPLSPGRVDLAEQAAFAVQVAAEGIAAGATLLIWFQLADDCGNGPRSYDAFGLVRNAGINACWAEPERGGQGCWRAEPTAAAAPRPSWHAWRAVVTYLGGAKPVGTVGGTGWSGRVFARPGGGRVTVAMSAADRTIVVPSSSGIRATVLTIDRGGVIHERTTTSDGRGYAVAVAASANRNGPGGRPMVDGLPAIVVEGGAAAGSGAMAAAAPGAPATGQTQTAPDTTPPVLAVVGVLPPESPESFTLQVASGDDGSGLAHYVLYWAIGRPPSGGRGWIPYGTITPWPGPGHPRVGLVEVPFAGQPGRTYYFAAQSGDAAGNWTALPASAQAWTRVVGPTGRRTAPVGSVYD